MTTCENLACQLPAEWNVRTPRGENVDLCTAHKDLLVAALINRPLVTRVET